MPSTPWNLGSGHEPPLRGFSSMLSLQHPQSGSQCCHFHSHNAATFRQNEPDMCILFADEQRHLYPSSVWDSALEYWCHQKLESFCSFSSSDTKPCFVHRHCYAPGFPGNTWLVLRFCICAGTCLCSVWIPSWAPGAGSLSSDSFCLFNQCSEHNYTSQCMDHFHCI